MSCPVRVTCPLPAELCSGSQRQGRLTHGSRGSGRTVQLAASWEGSREGHELGIPHAASSLQPAITQGTLFLSKKVLHICSAAAGQESRSEPERGDETSLHSLGHVRSRLPAARTPPPRSPGPAGQAPSACRPLPLCFPGVSVSFRLPTHADVETWKIFRQPKCCFLSGAASSSSHKGGLMYSLGAWPPHPSQPAPNERENAGKSRLRSEPARRGCGGSVPINTLIP